jgi:hypothetical protein
MIVFILLLLLIIFWYYTQDIYNPKNEIASLKKLSDTIIQKAKINPKPSYKIYETNDYPHTINNNIYIVVKRPDGQKYDPDTIVQILCHELAHILSGVGDSHGTYFEYWENLLLDVAENLGYYYKGVEIAKDYPCYE